MEAQRLDGTIIVGSSGNYYWLTSSEQYMGDLVRLCPYVLLGRYLTVTSIDSGSPWLTDIQRAAGWELRSGMAFSRLISSSDELFYQRDGNDCPGYDEWYVFDTARTHLGEILQGNPFEEGNTPRPGRLLVFASWGAFVLHDPDPIVQSINDMFWRQLNLGRTGCLH